MGLGIVIFWLRRGGKMESSLGCGKRFKNINLKQKEVSGDCDFICGVANAHGKEYLCKECDGKMRATW